MDIHQNARTTPHSRAGLVKRMNAGELPKTVAAGVGVCEKTVRKWARRFAREGPAGLADRSSRPHRLRRPTAPALVEQAIALRRQRLLMKHIAAQLELSIATVSRLLKRAGLSRLSSLDSPLPVQRYEYAAPGDLLHPTPRSSAASTASARASPALTKNAASVPASKSPTSASTTIRAWPTPKSCPTREKRPLPPSCRAPSITSRPLASRPLAS